MPLLSVCGAREKERDVQHVCVNVTGLFIQTFATWCVCGAYAVNEKAIPGTSPMSRTSRTSPSMREAPTTGVGAGVGVGVGVDARARGVGGLPAMPRLEFL